MRASLAGTAGLFCGATGWAAFIEPEQLDVARVPIHLPRLPAAFEGVTIAQLSDLHYGPFTGAREIGGAVERANALSPDLVVVTGDYITSPLLEGSRTPPSVPLANAVRCAQILSGLRAPLGVAAILGNHDAMLDASYVASVLQSHGLRVLRNSSFALERDHARVWLAGVEDVLESTPRLDLALTGVPRDEAVVLLAHEPDFADQASHQPIDLQLSGHSHGGQVRLPLLGAPYLPRLARKYPYGYYRVGPLQLYTNRGIGTIGLPLRLGATPEVTLFTLRRGPGGTP